MRFTTYKDIIRANLKIIDQTHTNYGNALQKFEEIINFFIKIAHNSADSRISNNSNDNFYNAYVLYQYYELPMSFRSCITLMEQGLYVDAFKLIRSLLEGLVKIKYFHKNNQLLELFEAGKKHISFKTMFTNIEAEEAYYKIYKHLSKFEHNNIGAKTVSLNQLLLNDKNINLMPTFNPHLVGNIINYLISIFYGYLNFGKVTFIYNENLDDQKIKLWLKQQIESHKQNFPDATQWHNHIQQVVGK